LSLLVLEAYLIYQHTRYKGKTSFLFTHGIWTIFLKDLRESILGELRLENGPKGYATRPTALSTWYHQKTGRTG
jgi:hypothetical protein